MSEGTVAQRLAQLCDYSVPDWPGEIDFYRELAAPAPDSRLAILEVACGTGCVCMCLASEGVDIVGLDSSAEMLHVARKV